MYLFMKEKRGGIGMNYSQKYFVIMGIIFLFMSGFMILTGIMTHSAPPSPTYTLLAMMVMCFCLS